MYLLVEYCFFTIKTNFCGQSSGLDNVEGERGKGDRETGESERERERASRANSGIQRISKRARVRDSAGQFAKKHCPFVRTKVLDNWTIWEKKYN